ncbi:hypothetical protein RIF29_16037 [Crotalaria pallida]|uniref:Uncharacterized protein n=1 Tax=Crotalaria pallida TaxID=3830 RepID=A0AAN9FK82_CROPI
MEFEVDDNTEAASKGNENHFSDESSGELSGDESDSNYLASSSEDEDMNTETEDEVWGSCEESERCSGKQKSFDGGETYGAAIWQIPELYGELNSPQLERITSLDTHTGKMFPKNLHSDYDVEEAQCGINAAHVEAENVVNGIGVVKLMDVIVQLSKKCGESKDFFIHPLLGIFHKQHGGFSLHPSPVQVSLAFDQRKKYRDGWTTSALPEDANDVRVRQPSWWLQGHLGFPPPQVMSSSPRPPM